MNHIFQTSVLIMEYIELNWLCKHIKKIRSSQPATLVLNWVKHQSFPVSIVKSFQILFDVYYYPHQNKFQIHKFNFTLIQNIFKVSHLKQKNPFQLFYHYRTSESYFILDFSLHLIIKRTNFTIYFFCCCLIWRTNSDYQRLMHYTKTYGMFLFSKNFHQTL